MRRRSTPFAAVCLLLASAVSGTSTTTGFANSQLQADLERERVEELHSGGFSSPQVVSVGLEMSQVDSHHRASFLSSLKTHWTTNNNPVGMALLEELPLQEQVLNEKRLATYFGNIKIGGEPFKMLFDTGSCEFWIPSNKCTEFTEPASRCAKHDKFQPSASKTFKEFRKDQKMSIQYLSGKVEGPLGRDVISLGDLEVKDQTFGMADEVDVPLLDEVMWDGIVGLAYPNQKLADAGVKPLFDNIMDHKLLQNNVFSYYLGYSGGALTFGGIDERFIAKNQEPSLRGNHAFSHEMSLLQTTSGTTAAHPFVYAKVVEQSYWTIEIMDIELQFGDDEPESTGVCANKPNGRCRAIVDTGTYLIYGPRNDVMESFSEVRLDACSDIKNLPKITFVFFAGDDAEPARLTLLPHDYVLEFHVSADGSGTDCNVDKNRKDDNKCKADCVIGIGPDNDDGWTLGQVFLRSFYSVFDRDTDRIGFVRSNPNVV